MPQEAIMKTVFADFNAMTEGERVRLTTRGSQEDIDDQGIQIGDHVWLSDGELLVGAEVAQDPRYVVVGIPAWDTLVNLDDAQEADFNRSLPRFQELSQSQSRSRDGETEILQLLATIERKAPQAIKSMMPDGYIAYRRAVALHALGHLELALQEAEQALAENPHRASYLHFRLELLRRVDLERAIRVARSLAEDRSTRATVLAACVNVLATHLETLPDEAFETELPTLLQWAEWFRNAPDITTVPVSSLSLVWFNRGMALLRRSRMDEARESFSMILEVNPKDRTAQQAIALDRYDAVARELAAGYRAIPVAAA
jgi:tetratricopeptide (TPR) repeat protein